MAHWIAEFIIHFVICFGFYMWGYNKGKRHRSEEGEQMKDTETVITISTDAEEWYGEEYTCTQCGGMFMAGSGDFEDEDNTCIVKFCPYCGRKIIGWRKGKHTQFTFKEND